ncbi:MAG: hypothetical protein V1837_01980 [Candidatus Woesearchaeota archaeon]
MKRGLAISLTLVLFLVACKPDLSEERITKDSTGAMADCSKASDNEQIGCYQRISEVLQTTDQETALNACSLILDLNAKKGCYESIFESQPDFKVRFNLCMRFDVEDIKIKCLETVSVALATTDLDLALQACKAMPVPKDSDSGPIYDCLQNLIRLQNNTSPKLRLCNEISRQDWRNNCIEQLAKEEKDPVQALSVCNNISDDQNFKEHCYGDIGAGSSNLGVDVELLLCEGRTDKDRCYEGIAREVIDSDPAQSVQICNKISSMDVKSQCLNNFISSPELIKANSALAITVCESQSISTKSRCFNDAARALAGSDPKAAALVCQKLGDDIQISDCYGTVWFYSNQLTLDNYDFALSLCNVLTLKRDDCLNRIVPVFIDSNRPKAVAVCKLMSSASSNGCLQQVQR